MSTNQALREAFEELRLIDHHCHGVIRADVDRVEFEANISESSAPPPAGTTRFDTQVGFAIRGRCAPLLDLEPFASPEQYLARRNELGADEVNTRLLRAANLHTLGIETGHVPVDIADIPAMKAYAEADAFEIVRLEKLAETVAESLRGDDGAAGSFLSRVSAELDRRLATAKGVKTIAAYRIGLDFAAERPEPAQLRTAIETWFAQTGEGAFRLANSVIIRELIWLAIERGTAIQVHIGYGDDDLDLHRCNPLLLTNLIRAAAPYGARFMLLHCYPYHREAGYLADVFPHVYCDVGLAINYTGARSSAIIAESLELTPFSKALFSTDAFGMAELYYLGAALFREGLSEVFADFVDHRGWPVDEAIRVANMIAEDNAIRAYQLEE